MKLTNLRIHWSLSLLSGVFLLPIAALAWLFVNQSYKDIDFADKERAGNRYIAAVRQVMVPLARGEGGPAVASLTGVRQVDAEIGALMMLDDTLDQAAAATQQAAPAGASARAALAALRQLVTRVGDGSNLILDPDLDSYYCMDLVVLKLPQAIELAQAVLDSAHVVLLQDKPQLADLAALQARLGEFSAVLDGISGSLQSAYRGNADGSLRVALAQPFSQLEGATKAYVSSLETFAQAAAGGQRPDDSQLAKLKNDTVTRLDGVWEATATELGRLLDLRIGGFYRKMITSLGASGVLLLLAVVLAGLIALSIRRPVAQLIVAMNGMAGGDLTVAVPARNRGDELGDLARAAGEMREQLHQLALEVRSHAHEVHAAAKDIFSAVEGQAATSSEMSASVAEITSTMEELSASSTQIAEHSKSVVDIASGTYDNAQRGTDSMAQVLTRMADIQHDNQNSLREIVELGARSKEISKVMEIINAVADQTKLIAFNAALEAASAGEAGRRFGVVAAEIRRLADSVTDSTGEIEGKISQIQDSISRLVITSEKGAAGIDSGMEATSHTAGRLDDLVEAARQTSSAAQQISLSTQQQRTASNQVVVALREIVGASGHTAHSITRISDISRDMSRLSAELDTLVNRFRLDAGPTV